MADQKNSDRNLSIDEITTDDLEEVSGGKCGGCTSCSTPPSPGPVEPVLNQA